MHTAAFVSTASESICRWRWFCVQGNFQYF